MGDLHQEIIESGSKNIAAMQLHSSRVQSVWGRHRPEMVLKQLSSHMLVLTRVLGMGGKVWCDGQLGLTVLSGYDAHVIPFRQIHADYASDEYPTVGAYEKGTVPMLGLICWTTVWDADGVHSGYCLAPVVGGQRTCDHPETPLIMGTPIPVEWSIHS
jgi:hypothetical protein